MSFLGGLIGLLILSIIYVTTASFVGAPFFIFGPLATIAPIVSFIAVMLGLLNPTTWLVVASFMIMITFVFIYTLATTALLPTIAAATGAGAPTTAPPPPAVAPLPNNLVENFMRGVMIGMTAGLNISILLLLLPLPLAPGIALLLGLICFLATIPPISGNILYQGILAWFSWLMPFSYLANAVGILLFVANLPGAIAAAVTAGAPSPVRFDGLTSTIETTGGALIGISGFIGGFNLGHFTFVTPGPPPGGRTAFFGGATGGLSSHETGHTLNAAAFGGVFHWINAIDENVVPFSRNSLAYGELTAESHFPRGGTGLGVGPGPVIPVVPRQHVAIW
jgi:hypothetical protein